MGRKPDLNADQQQLRDLTRQAHEAAQELHFLLKEVRQARADVPAAAEKIIEKSVNIHMDEVNGALNQALTDLNAVIRREEKRTREHYSELLGRDGADMILRTCGMVLHLAVPAITSDQWMAQIREIAAQQSKTGCNCLGCIAVAAADPHGIRDHGIVVTTPDMVDEIRRRDPDRIVIDMR
jgi:hypothetical protein